MDEERAEPAASPREMAFLEQVGSPPWVTALSQFLADRQHEHLKKLQDKIFELTITLHTIKVRLEQGDRDLSQLRSVLLGGPDNEEALRDKVLRLDSQGRNLSDRMAAQEANDRQRWIEEGQHRRERFKAYAHIALTIAGWGVALVCAWWGLK